MSNKKNYDDHTQPSNNDSETAKDLQKKGGSHAIQRKIRFDRIAIVVIPLFLIIILITALCMHSCNARNNNKTSSETPVASSTTTMKNVSTPIATNITNFESTTDAQEESEMDSSSIADHKKEVTMRTSGVKEGNLIVINQEHSYSFQANDISLVSVYENHNDSYSVSDMEVKLDNETVQHLNEMMDRFAAETGITGMQVFNGYRTKEDQQSRFENGSSVFAGGCSDYHSGRTFNLKINFGDGTSDYYNPEKYPDYSWISEHAAEYGFIVRYPNGKDSITGEEGRYYTFRYVGIPHAAYITQNDLCLEEYVEKIQGFTKENPLEITENGTTYAVYYVPVKSEEAQAKFTVLSDTYTVSGDNIGGFIVTCQMKSE